MSYNNTTKAYLLDTSASAPPGYDSPGVLLGYLRPTVGGTGAALTTVYTRNPLGQVTQIASPAVTYTYTYDAAHRLQTVTDSRGPKTLTYTYSPGGLRNSVTDSDGNRTSYLYDPVGRLTGIWAPTGDLVAFAYDAGGRLTEKVFPNGARTRYAYNPDNTLARLTNYRGSAESALISQHDYTYDGVGNRITHLERLGDTTTHYGYTYDPLNRLTTVTDTSTSTVLEAFTYDPFGNRLTKTAGETVTHYCDDGANQLTRYDAGTPNCTGEPQFTYDANGNLVTRTDGTTTRMAYDAENHLAWISVANQPAQTYPDFRYWRVVSGVTR